MAEYSECEAEVEGEEFEGEDAGQRAIPVVPVVQEPPPESDSKKKAKGKRKKAPPPIRINLSACKYEVLRIVQRKLGWKEVGDDDDWELYWTDTSVSIERIMKLTKIQKINHFSGMLEICRKRAMARNLMKMARQFPQHFDFFPRTFILPGDREEFMADIRSRGKKQVYILKPDAGCQGRGIRLVQGGKEEVVAKVLNEMATPNVVAQHYLSAPLLIHGYKFDLRIYALVLSCDPLRVFLFHEGLARICTEKYSPPKASNLEVSFMHLTNYAVNKKNEAFVAASAASADSGEDASKWCLAQLRQYLTAQGHNYDKVWADIADLIIKSLCSVQPILRNNYRSVLPPDNDGFSCFEILGYDIMLDDQLRPWLIEVNHSPSFNIDSPLDLSIKEELITQTIELVRVDPKIIAKTKKAEKRAATSRLLEPMHVKKQLTGRMGPPGGPQSASGQQGGEGKGDGEEGGGGGGGGGGAAAAKPRTPEEYEAWRAKVLTTRERYEAKHMGNFTRIFPAPDPAKQALYEELLKGSSEIYQASFQSRSKRPDASDDKKRREDAETDAQKAERLKARAHRDKLAQMAVERRKFKLMQQQAQQGAGAPSLLPAYLTPPQPYLSSTPSSGGQVPGTGSGGTPVYYVAVPPGGPYQYDPSVYQQFYMQQAYLYGNTVAGAGGGGTGAATAGGQRPSEVYGERSDVSAGSSRPVSALSNGSNGGGGDSNGSGQPPPIRIYSGPLARAAAGSSGSGQRPLSSTATSGRSSPLIQHAGSASGAQLLQLQQQLQAQLQLQQQQTQLQQQGALPPHPFLGAVRRPSSATSRASPGAGAGGEGASGAGGEWPTDPAGPTTTPRRGGVAAAGGRTASPSGFSANGGGGAAGGGAAAAGAYGRMSTGAGGLGGGGGSSHSFTYSHGPSAAFQQLSEPLRPVSVGSAHNHVRHAHSSALEAAGAAFNTGPPPYLDLGAGERDQPSGPGPGGPGRGLFINGSRPPSASTGPASLRDKLQPGGVAGTAVGGATARKQYISAALSTSTAAAAATWDAAMAAAAAAAGQDPAAFLHYFSAVRSRPESASHRLRPTSAAPVPRSPSPLGTLHSGNSAAGVGMGGPGVAAAAAGGALSPSGAGGGGVNSPGGIARTGSGGGRYGSADMYVLGLTQTLMQQALSGMSGGVIGSGGVGGVVGFNPTSPKAQTSGAGGGGGGGGTPQSPRVITASPAGPNNGLAVGPSWDAGGGASASGMSAAMAGRAYKQSRATGVAPYPALTARSASSGAIGQVAATVSTLPYYQQQQQLGGMLGIAGGATGGFRPSEDEPPPVCDDDDDSIAEDDGSPFTYQPLGMPDANGERYGTAATAAGATATGVGGGRNWSTAGTTAAGAGAGSGPGSATRQRSTTGVAAGGVYVSATSVPAITTPGSGAGPGGGPGGGLLVGSPGSLASRPPVYPPSGGGPGMRPGGAPTSGRAGSAVASTAAAASGGGGSAGGSALSNSGGGRATVSGASGMRLNPSGFSSSGLPPGLPGTGAVHAGGSPHSGLSVAGNMIGRGASGGIGTLQGGIEGLQITATALDLDSQLRGAAMAALNRKGLAVKGRKVAGQ